MRRKKTNSGVETSFPPNVKRVDNQKSSARKRVHQQPNALYFKKVLHTAFRFFITFAVTAVVIWVGVAAYRHATTSKYFSLRDFEITGLKRLSEAEVLKTAGIATGSNIFEVDEQQARRLLKEHQWIADARVERRLPRAIRIEIEERRARAVVFFDVPYLVDKSGEVFKRWARGDPIPSPILTGFTRRQFTEEPELVRETVCDALALDDRYRAAGLNKIAPLVEIMSEIDGSFSLTLGEDQTYVYFGKGPFRQKMRKLAKVLTALKRDGQSPQTIYFDNEIRPNRVTVKLKKQNADRAMPSNDSGREVSEQKRVSKI